MKKEAKEASSKLDEERQRVAAFFPLLLFFPSLDQTVLRFIHLATGLTVVEAKICKLKMSTAE